MVTTLLKVMPRTRGRRIRLGIYLGVTAIVLTSFHRFLFLGNFDVVEPGRVFRSAQPKLELEQTILDHRIKTVLNLRGGSPANWWYRNEMETTRRLGVDFLNRPMSATRRPSRAELKRILEVFDECRYPLLIHCKSGSDRTGLAVALYRLVKQGEPPEEAEAAFSPWRGHIPAFGCERLHDPIREYADWLARQNLSHTPERFRSWLDQEYRDEAH